jgi:N-acetylglucosamine-6-phosphate deacetylase
VEEVLQAARFHAAGGVTALLPAVMTDAWPRMIRAVKVIRQAKLNAAGPEILGVHLEGPFISLAYKGAHPEEHLSLPTSQQMEEIIDIAGRDLSMITLAPELPHALDAVSYFSRKGVVTALGHSGASYEQVRQAISQGLAYAVHTFSAMTGFHHRAPGALGAVLTSDELSAELIADGVHTHPAAMKLLYRAKGYDRVVLASDSSPAAGYAKGEILMAGRKVMVREGAPRLADGTLAGSNLTMNRALAGAVLMAGIPFDKAVASATLNPARVLGIDSRKGSLSVGKDADVVVMNRSFEVLITIGKGTILYNRADQF